MATSGYGFGIDSPKIEHVSVFIESCCSFALKQGFAPTGLIFFLLLSHRSRGGEMTL